MSWTRYPALRTLATLFPASNLPAQRAHEPYGHAWAQQHGLNFTKAEPCQVLNLSAAAINVSLPSRSLITGRWASSSGWIILAPFSQRRR